MQLKDTISLAYGDSLSAVLTTRVDWNTVKVRETHDQERDSVESEKGADVSEMRNLFISPDILEE